MPATLANVSVVLLDIGEFAVWSELSFSLCCSPTIVHQANRIFFHLYQRAPSVQSPLSKTSWYEPPLVARLLPILQSGDILRPISLSLCCCPPGMHGRSRSRACEQAYPANPHPPVPEVPRLVPGRCASPHVEAPRSSLRPDYSLPVDGKALTLREKVSLFASSSAFHS